MALSTGLISGKQLSNATSFAEPLFAVNSAESRKDPGEQVLFGVRLWEVQRSGTVISHIKQT